MSVEQENFIQNIRESKLNEVKKFLESNQQIKKIYDGENVSVLMISLQTLVNIEKSINSAFEALEETEELIALKENQLEIHESLVNHGFTLGPHESIESLVGELELRTRINLRRIHKTFQEASLKHLTLLLTKSKLAHHHTLESDRRKFNPLIARVYEELNAIKWIEPVLKVAAFSDELKIIFDFNSDTIENVDPTATKFVHGAAYSEEVFIGAAKLLNDDDRHEALGHLAHELSHFAIELLYRNNAKPYTKLSDDKIKFENVLKACERNKETEKYISVVFSRATPVHLRHTELIVRVPHLLALYKENQEKLDKAKEIFSELFLFYETKTLIDLEREYPLMEARKEIKNLNELAGVASKLKVSEILFKVEALKLIWDSEKVSVVSSNCPQLTMQMIHQQLKAQNELYFESLFVFVKLETVKNEKLFAMALKAFNSAMKPTLIVDASIRNQEIFEILKSNDLIQRIIVVQHKKLKKIDHVASFEVKHRWSDLKFETQAKLVETSIIFQGIIVQLKDFLPLDSDALDLIPLQSLLEDSLEISRELSFVVPDIYIERTFRRSGLFDNETFNSDKLIEIVETNKVVLLSSDPGTGKTTEFKKLAKKLKNKFPTNWILFVDLKEFVEAYEKDGKPNPFQSSDDVAKFFCEKIIKLKDFDEIVFTQLFNQNRVIFLLDGFDEVSPSFKQFNINLTKTIRDKTQNQLWISTRTHLEAELMSELDCIVVQLEPFDSENRESLINQLLHKKGLTEYYDLTEKIEEKKRLLDRLSGEIVIASPILIRMVMDLNDEEIKLTKESNSYLVYKIFVYKIVENFIKKGFEAENELIDFLISSTDVIGFHQIKAIKEFFNEADDFELVFKPQNEIPSEKMARVGLMIANSSGQLQFIHRTFAEFFIVEFFNRNISSLASLNNESPRKQNLIKMIRILFKGDHHFDNWSRFDTNNLINQLGEDEYFDSGRFDVIRGFFDGLFETLILTNDEEKLKIVKRMFQTTFTTNELSLMFLHAADQGFISTIKMFEDIDDEQNQMKNLWTKSFIEILTLAARKHSLKFIDQFISFARKTLGEEAVETLFEHFEKLDEWDLLLKLALSNRNEGVFRYFTSLPAFRIENPNIKKIFIARCDVKQENKSNISYLLIYTLHNVDDEDKQAFFEMLSRSFSDEEIKCILSATDAIGKNIIAYLCLGFTKGSENFVKLLSDKFTKDELKDLATSTYGNGYNSLKLAARIFDEKNFRKMWSFLKESIADEERFKQALLEVHGGFQNVLSEVSINPVTAVFNIVLSEYESYFDINKMKEILTKQEKNSNIFLESIDFYKENNKMNAKTCEALWKYMQEILDHESLMLLLPNFKTGDEEDLTKISFNKVLTYII